MKKVIPVLFLLLAIASSAQNSTPAPNLDIPKGMK